MVLISSSTVASQPQGQSALGDQVRGTGPDDVHAQHFLVLGVGDDLHQTLAAVDDEGLAVATSGNLPTL